MIHTQILEEKFGPNSGYIEEIYQLYLNDPSLVGHSWATFFEQLESEIGQQKPATNGTPRAIEYKPQVVHQDGAAPSQAQPVGYYAVPAGEMSTQDAGVKERIYRLISAFRGRGHLKANVNPLTAGIMPLPTIEDINVDFYKFTPDQLSRVFGCAGFAGQQTMRLADLIEELHRVYCNTIGFDFIHLLNQEERLWLQGTIECRFQNGYRFTTAQKLRRLQKIVDAEAFEGELHKKYVGHKRFSLEGAETLIPMLDTVLEEAGEEGIREAVLGMAHRGRLNVLVNTLGKPLEEIFSEFEDQNIHSALGSGDVKYHMGFRSTYRSPSGQTLDLRLAPNPSHLEFVDPVVEGMCRALQDVRYGRDRKKVLPILIHGDGAFIGQGVVPETLNLSRVAGYATGGTVHVIINNQIGFTTSPEESRSSIYCTDMAKAVQAPIFHVNGEDVEASCWAIRTALEFRNRYQRDVIIDLYCYRKYGHNEGDDPSFTQPSTYKEIREKKSIATLYGERLVEESVISEGQMKDYFESFKQRFEAAHTRGDMKTPIGDACAVHGRLRVPTPETGVKLEALERIAQTLITYPDGFTVHPKLQKILEKRVETLQKDSGIEWGFAEALAFGSLLFDGISIRLSGQDSGRGTFSQRHVLLNDYEGVCGEYPPLTKLTEDGAPGVFEVYNSTLSEAGVMGFEFGYSSSAPNTLVLWEAQFGDFANGAQVIIDQFIAAAEAKWGQLSGVVLLLPHGYEGQGPEHSSARLERYLQLCAEGNMVVCYPSSSSQYFHLLRRQGLLTLKRPLVVMTPKSLLRLPAAACSVAELTEGRFHTVMEDNFSDSDASIKHIFLMSGKIYYDVKNALDEAGIKNAKIIRLEQLYPFPQFELKKALKDLTPKDFHWVQEEPRNMGAWTYVEPYFRRKIEIPVEYIGRPVAASTATGSSRRHAAETKEILDQILNVVRG